ncbi:GGDEF domain-containing response regulator [Spirochaeta isovalerica]|uniref:diguanylate cyclase n=1 Tax=Spirochaeta isovalerica TaxID=150 RepID=A0A841R523_9SPIO|nr:diguanylate cyclase [Spirochaeta isovalerica]MBB6478916.1 diguanylate cyclase (GGDEF)-like protein [Spirochaeta isovalerica]
MSQLCNVLIVEADSKNVETTVPLLRKMNSKVSYVKQGLNVVTHLQKKGFDLVLLADKLPDEDGFRVLRRIREKAELKNIPVLMMLSEDESKKAAFESGASDYIVKPYMPYELVARVTPYISLVLDRQKFTDECQRKDKIAKQLDEAFTEMEIMSRLDPLTRVYNRRAFLEKITDEQIRSRRSQKKFTLLLANIIKCRHYNERHGYECGDFIIKKTAELIHGSLRERDLTARWSGDKFMILLPETESDGLEIIQTKINKVFQESSFEFKGMNHRIDLSFSSKVCTGNDDLDLVLKEIE